MKGVSVCIPLYNTEMFIEQAIESVLIQTVKPAEIIIHDNCSTDNSLKIASKYPVKILSSKKNGGIGFARKRLVEEAKGEYLCFLSADDIMLPDYIKTMLETAKKHPNSIIYSNYDIVDENGTFIRRFEADTYECYADWVVSNIYKAKSDTMSVCYNILAPSGIMKKNNFNADIIYGEDLEHLLRCTLVKEIKYFHIPKVLFRYRIHLSSVTSKKKADTTKNNRKIFEKINSALGRELL